MSLIRVLPQGGQLAAPQLAGYRALLEEQWRRQVAEVTHLALEAFAPRHLRPSNNYGRAEDLDVLAWTTAAVREQLAETDAALLRLENGCFGTCVDCRQPIPAERLALLPAVPCCMTCCRRRADVRSATSGQVPDRVRGSDE
jgi:DnaK suppressor protein